MKKEEFGALSFWAWNSLMDDESIKRRIEEFYEQGLRGFFMHSRAGLKTEYLSEEWFHACETAARLAGEREMEAWIYDEDGWPSGFAGGLVTACGKDYQAKTIRIVTGTQQCDTQDNVPQECVPQDRVSQECNGEWIISFRKVDGEYRACSLKDGELNFYCMIEPDYVDLLSEKVTQKFIEVTYEKYKEKLAPYFGNTIPGFFTDEPQLNGAGWPYSYELEDYFTRRNGYSLIQNLYQLVLEEENSRQFRMDYWDTIQEMMKQHFVKQIYDWCEENQMIFTGHFPGEDSLVHQMDSTAGVMPKYQYMQRPGIDHLGKRITPVVLTKQVTSAAKQYGRKKILSETFGCSGWNVSFSWLCYIWGWQAAAGINIPCLHIGAHSLQGIRKRDYPACFSYQEPWWKYFHHVEQWMEGLSWYLSQGEWTEQVLVVSPLKSFYLYHRLPHSEQEQHYGAAYRKLLENLMDIQVGFDLGDEEIMKDCARVQGGRMIVGNCSYSIVIVAEGDYLEPFTWSLLQDFRSQGGTVLFTTRFPEKEGSAGFQRQAEWVIQNSRAFWYKCFARLQYKSAVLFQEKDGGAVAAGLAVAVKQLDHSELCYVWNRYESSIRFLKAVIQGRKKVFLLQPETGQRTELEVRYAEQSTLAPITLSGRQSLLLEIEEGSSDCKDSEVVRTRRLKGRLSPESPNALVLDYAAFSLDGIHFSEELPIVKLHPILYREVDQTKAAWVQIRYRFTNRMSRKISVDAVIEDDHCTKILCNGVDVIGKRGDWYLDEAMRKYPVGDLLKQGENELVLTYELPENQLLSVDGLYETQVNRFFYPVEPEAVLILGAFRVQPEQQWFEEANYLKVCAGAFYLEDALELSDMEDITSQGFWFYRGNLSIKVRIEKQEGIQLIRLHGLHAAAALIRCRDSEKITYMEPFEIDITDLLLHGEEEVEILLLGTNRNILGPHHHRKGEVNYTGPNTFKGSYGYEDIIVNPEIRSENTWTDDYAFVPFGCEYLELIHRI